jgi:hypothetical protein
MLQDNFVKFVSEPASPSRHVNILEEGKGKAKELREVDEGDDTVIVEDTSDEEDEETLHERFQLWSRFSRPGLPNVPLINDPSTSLEEAAQCCTQVRRQKVESHRDYVSRSKLLE